MEQVEREIVPFPSSMYSASLVSKIIYDKYALSIPFYRQEQAFNDLGINITRSDMVNYLSKTYDLIKPLYDKYAELIKEVDILNCDETRLKVISQKNENNNVKTGYIEHPNIMIRKYYITILTMVGSILTLLISLTIQLPIKDMFMQMVMLHMNILMDTH